MEWGRVASERMCNYSSKKRISQTSAVAAYSYKRADEKVLVKKTKYDLNCAVAMLS